MGIQVLLIFLLCTVYVSSTTNPQVAVNGGIYQGIFVEKYNVSAYLGITYANAARWELPVMVSNITGTYFATSLLPPCPQTLQYLDGYPMTPLSTGENCLSLNIWVPSQASPTHVLPVVVWLPGGFFVSQQPTFTSPGSPYNGAALAAEQQVIIVTVSYRVGLFGFLPVDADGTSNFGLYDQLAALKWVNQSIQAFGGNSSSVTLGGQGTGAICVCIHLISTYSAGLFHRADIESGACILPLRDGRTTPDILNIVSTAVGCTQTVLAAQVACLKFVPAHTLVDVMSNLSITQFLPYVDHDIVQNSPIESFTAQYWNVVPLLVGSQRTEGSIMFDIQVTEQQYVETVQAIFGLSSWSVIPTFLEAANYNYSSALAQLYGDYYFSCQSFTLSQFLSSQTSVYYYNFEAALTYQPFSYYNTSNPLVNNTLEVYHTGEIPYIWLSERLQPAELQLGRELGKYWGSFWYTGNPNYDNASVQWPVMGTVQNILTVRNNASSSIIASSPDKFLSDHMCNFLSQIGPPTWFYVAIILGTFGVLSCLVFVTCAVVMKCGRAPTLDSNTAQYYRAVSL